MDYRSGTYLGVDSTGLGEEPGVCFAMKFSSDSNPGYHSHCVGTLVRQKLSVRVAKAWT